jgi:hypothetical protein
VIGICSLVVVTSVRIIDQLSERLAYLRPFSIGQRKKTQMQNLQQWADDLKEEQMRLRQIIYEQNTANILVELFSQPSGTDDAKEDPRVEEILRRSAEEMPDASKVPELPALILPGQHASKKIRAMSTEEVMSDPPSDGIDYDLLGKDRSKCTPEELDRIRRERNRMHAKSKWMNVKRIESDDIYCFAREGGTATPQRQKLTVQILLSFFRYRDAGPKTTLYGADV